MNSKAKIIFLVLVLLQGLHSVEEYVGKLWDVFPPAKYLTNLFSENNETGFLIVNVGIFIIGILCWLLLYSKFESTISIIIWIFIIIETINGIGHPVWSIYQKSYTPGVISAPFLLVTALYLARQLH